MTIPEIISSNELTLSFEVFPPKADASADMVMKAARDVAALQPSYVSVTYGAGGGTIPFHSASPFPARRRALVRSRTGTAGFISSVSVSMVLFFPAICFFCLSSR